MNIAIVDAGTIGSHLAARLAHAGANIAIVAIKAHSSVNAVPDIQALLGSATPVVLTVNGIPWRYLHQHFKSAKTAENRCAAASHSGLRTPI